MNCAQGWNAIGPKEMKALAEALRYNRSLVSIELQHNCLAVEGGAILGEVLYDNRFLPPSSQPCTAADTCTW